MKLALTLALFTLSAAAQDRLADTLRKAVLEEDSHHNLAAAEAGYQRVIAQFDEGRSTAASALFRLAECDRKEHKNAEAQAAYERVVREFADQQQLAEQSRAILASTYHVSAPSQATSEAKQRYRSLLLQQIEICNRDIANAEGVYKAGVAPYTEVSAAQARKLKLQRDLAAFDMGIIPVDGK